MDYPEIPGYRVQKLIRAGGMASVFLAEQTSISRLVALKVMAPHLLSDPSFSERFLREAKIAAELRHPSFVTIYDMGHHGDHHYISMELLHGGDLQQLMKRNLPLTDGIRFIKDIASALHYASAHHFIHRDVKPDNILMRDKTAVLCDFGIAKSTANTTQMTQVGTVMGTPAYMSPEQAQSRELDGRSDLYSLAIIFYEMLCGHPPFTGDSAVSTGIMHCTEPIPRLPLHLVGFQSFIDTAMAKSPSDRFQSGSEMIAALERLEESESGLIQKAAKTVIVTPGSNAAAGNPASTRKTDHPNERVASGTVKPVAHRQGSHRSAALAVSVFTTLGVGATGWWMYDSGAFTTPGSGSTPRQETTDAHSIEVPGDPESPPTSSIAVNPPVPDTNDEQVERLLQEARNLTVTRRLYRPMENNAIERLEKLLLLDPDNASAKHLLDEVYNMVYDEAAGQLAIRQPASASLAIAALDEGRPNDPRIPGLKSQLIALQSGMPDLTQQDESPIGSDTTNRPAPDPLEPSKQTKALSSVENKADKTTEVNPDEQQVRKLLSEANTVKGKSGITNNNYRELAYIYRNILILEKKNLTAIEGIENIAAYGERLAREAISGRNFEKAKRDIAHIARLSPDYRGLESLKEYYLNAQERHGQAMQKLATAEQLIATPYVKPGARGNNRKFKQTLRKAADLLQSVYANDGESVALAATENRLIQKYVTIINIHLSDGDRDEANEFTEELKALSFSDSQYSVAQQTLKTIEERTERTEPVIPSF